MNDLSKAAVSLVTVDESGEGQRIDNFLARHLKGVPKSHIYRILRSGEVRVNSKRVDATCRLAIGDTVDFWRVEAVERDRLVRLRAEMKVPGRAWLQFEVLGEGERSVIRQTALFEPRGLAGLAYWYALYPVHSLIFAGMLRRIGAAAER